MITLIYHLIFKLSQLLRCSIPCMSFQNFLINTIHNLLQILNKQCKSTLGIYDLKMLQNAFKDHVDINICIELHMNAHRRISVTFLHKYLKSTSQELYTIMLTQRIKAKTLQGYMRKRKFRVTCTCFRDGRIFINNKKVF